MKKIVILLLVVLMLAVMTQNVFAQSFKGLSLGFEMLSEVDAGFSIFKVSYYEEKDISYNHSLALGISAALYKVVDEYGVSSVISLFSYDCYWKAVIVRAGFLDFGLQAGVTYDSVATVIVGAEFLAIGGFAELHVTPNLMIYSNFKIPVLSGMSVLGIGKLNFPNAFLFSNKAGFSYRVSSAAAIDVEVDVSNMNMLGMVTNGQLFTMGARVGVRAYF